MYKALRVLLLLGLVLAVGTVSAQAQDWWTWVYQVETDTLALRNSGGVQFELPRPRLPNEAGTTPALISVTPNGRTLIIASQTGDNRTEIGFYNIAARTFVQTHTGQPGEFVSTSLSDAAVYNPAGDQAAIALSSASGAWRVILFETATGNVIGTLTSDDPALQSIGLLPAANALLYIVGFAGEELWLERLVPGEAAELTPFVWLSEQDTVGVSEYYGLADSLLNGSLVFPYLDVTQPALDLPGVLTPYNTIAVLEGGEIDPVWLDQTRIHYAAQYVAGGDLIAYQAGVPDLTPRWYLLPQTEADLIPLPEDVEWVYSTPDGFLSVTAEGVVSYHDIEDPAQPLPAFTLSPDERIIWTLTEGELNFDQFSLTGQSGAIPPTPTPCVLRTDWFVYTVQRGDTLGSIARRAQTTIAELAAANCLVNVNIIYTGQTLYVPRIPATPTPSQVQVVAFNVTPASALPGQTVTIRWEVRGAQGATINLTSANNVYRQTFANLPPSGSLNYSIPQPLVGPIPPTINLELIPLPDTGVRATTVLALGSTPVEVVTFRVNPNTAQPGQTVTISWETRGTTAVALNLSSPDGVYRTSFANLPPTGNINYTVPEVFAGGVPSFVRIELATTPSTGFTPAISLTLQGAPQPEIVAFTSSSANARPGDTVSLNWEVRNAQGVNIQVTDPLGTYNTTLSNLAATGGTPFVIPQVFAGGVPASLTFTLSPVPDNGQRRAVTVTLTPSTPQIVSFTIDAQSAAPGQLVTLNWNVINAQSVSLRVVLPNGQVGAVYDGQPLQGSLGYTLPADPAGGTYSFQLVPQPETGVIQTLAVSVAGLPR
jgi:hypothetical protein